MYRLLTFAGALATVLFAIGGTAFAHARPTHAEPLPGHTATPSPTQVIMDFTEALEPRFSSITVQDAQGQRVDKGKVHAAPGDPKRLIVDLKPLAPGMYKVTWHAVSVDTHSTDGTWIFRVGP
jgi:copper resistance protein C